MESPLNKKNSEKRFLHENMCSPQNGIMILKISKNLKMDLTGHRLIAER